MQNRRGFIGRIIGAVAAAVVAPFAPAAVKPAALTFRGKPLLYVADLGGCDIPTRVLTPQELRELVQETLIYLGKTDFHQIENRFKSYEAMGSKFGCASERA